MYIYIYVYIYMYICICIYVYMYICIYIKSYVHLYTYYVYDGMCRTLGTGANCWSHVWKWPPDVVKQSPDVVAESCKWQRGSVDSGSIFATTCKCHGSQLLTLTANTKPTPWHVNSSASQPWKCLGDILEHARVCAKTRSQSSHMPQRLPAECALHRFVGKHGDRSKLLVFRLSLAVALGFPQPRKGVQFHYVPPISDTYNDHISPLIGVRIPWWF